MAKVSSIIMNYELKKIFIFAPQNAAESGSTSRSGNDTLTVETGVRIPYPILWAKIRESKKC